LPVADKQKEHTMVVKKKSSGEKKEKKGGVRVGKLQLNKETVKELTAQEQKRLRGGRSPKTDSCLYKEYCA